MVYYHFKLNKECIPHRAEKSSYHYFIVYQVNIKSLHNEYDFGFSEFFLVLKQFSVKIKGGEIEKLSSRTASFYTIIWLFSSLARY